MAAGTQATRSGRATGGAGQCARPEADGPRRPTCSCWSRWSLVFATGVGAVATGSPRGRWVVIAHGVAAIVVVLLIPWKSIVVRRGLRRGRPSRWASVLLAVLVVTTLVAGLGLGHRAGAVGRRVPR